MIPRSTMLAFHGISEFMVEPDFFNIVRRCAEAEASLSINTNASVCTPKHLDALTNYPGYLSINFSLDAATPETFLKIRGQDFWRICRNIKTFIDRFAGRRERTWVSLSFVITKSNVRDMVPFVYLAKALKVDVAKYYRLHEYEGLDWRVETREGGIFDYREECAGKFAQEYNREINRTHRAATILDVSIELPAPLTQVAPGKSNGD